MTELAAVNIILRQAGLREVPSLDDNDAVSDAALARKVLDEVELEVQSRGWYYNIRQEIQLTRESDNTVLVPTTAITIDTTYTSYGTEASQVGDKLLLVKDGSITFDEDPYVTYTVRYDFEAIPYPVREYIAWLAAHRYIMQQPIGQLSRIEYEDRNRRLNWTESRMIDAKGMAQRFNDQSSDDSLFDDPHTYNVTGRRVPTRRWN